MHHISSTPFGSRQVTAGLIQALEAAEAAAPLPHVNKWEVFRQLCTARHAYNLSDRDLTVLNALLSFHQGNSLGDNASLVVFPSNRALAERAHGMAESTLRRHVAALVQAGVIVRRDSPNGKRYAHKDRSGEVMRAFGFDLRPLLTRAGEFASNAAEAEAAADRIKALRTDVTLLKRDALKFALYGQEEGLSGDWDGALADLMEVHKTMRRKLVATELEEMAAVASEILSRVTAWLFIETDNMSGSDDDIERPFQNSNKEPSDSELCLEKQEGEGQGSDEPVQVDSCQLPLALIVKACPDLLPYADGEIRDWHSFVRAAQFVRGMMGISPSGYHEASQAMGPERAAVVTACILQRISEINSPGGYLRSLARKAQEGQFSEGPMVMALLNGAQS
ncbi:plasmid replication protein RepC [Octadecabacter ascidiaceicola]|nr:plasmid replication protein RepC [Octadecabacter ascidiaceicola]